MLIFATGNTFFQLNLVFIAKSRTGFRSGILEKYELNSEAATRTVLSKLVSLKILQILQENTCAEVSF